MIVSNTGLNRDAFVIVDGYWIPRHMIAAHPRGANGAFILTNGIVIKDKP